MIERVTVVDDNDLKIDDIVRSALKKKLERYISGKINSVIVKAHHGLPKKVHEEEGGPTNAMGTSSSTAGTGNIDIFDPLLFAKLARRKRPAKGVV